MEMTENASGEVVGESMNTKAGVKEQNGSVVHNGLGEESPKVNGNSIHVKNNLLNHNDKPESEVLDSVDVNDKSENNIPEATQKNELQPDEDLDNSTATSNISDISPYEDSEKSMDVEMKDEHIVSYKESNNVEQALQATNADTGTGKNKINNLEEEKDLMDVETGNSLKCNGSSPKFEIAEESESIQKVAVEKESQSDQNDDSNDKLQSETIVNKPPTQTPEDGDMEEDCKTVNKKDNSESANKAEDKENTSGEKKDEDHSVTGVKDSENFENETEKKSKIAEKVKDIDGSEILITLNVENEDSDHEVEGNVKEGSKDYKTPETKVNKESEKPVQKQSPEIVVVSESPDKKPEVVQKVSVATPFVTSAMNVNQTGSNTRPSVVPVATANQIRFPVMSTGPPIQYFVPSSIQPNTQQKYINVGGQQILITLPVSSLAHSLNTPILGNSAGINSQANLNPFPLPNPHKNPLDKTIDLDVPQASWEQQELIKYEVLQRKPDNAFWGGLANVSKKADLSAFSKFVFDLGSDIVKESAYEQIVQVQQKKEELNKLNDSEKESLQRMKKVVEELKEKLKYIHDMPTYKCKCGFTTDSTNVMNLHKRYPHVTHTDKYNTFSCPHCDESFHGKEADDEFKEHMVEVHKITPLANPKTSLWQCNLCSFDGQGKSTLMKHKFKCMKNFKQHLNQAPHHVDINLSLKNIFYKFQVNNRILQQSKIASIERPDTRTNKVPIAQKPVIQPRPGMPMHPITVNPNRPIIPSQYQSSVTGVSSANTWQNNYNRILANPGSMPIDGPRFAQIQRPPPPLKPSSTNKPTVNQLLKSQQPLTYPSTSTTNKSGFEVCEICGGYVKDRMSLRIHFFYAHKIEMPAHVFSKPLAPLTCNLCNERFWTSQGFAKHKTSVKHLQNTRKLDMPSNQCWICHQKPENLYSHLHKFHRLTTGECMALKRCMFCGALSHSRKELELHMAASHGVLIKGDENQASVPVTSQPPVKSVVPSNISTKNLSTVVTGGSSGMVRNNFCVFCSAQFHDNTKLTLHCLSVHATCKKCGMVVNKNADLVRHVCKMSSKTCNICGLKNLKPAGLLKHFESHTKPCRVALKRLSPSQIENATGRKFPRHDRQTRHHTTGLEIENKSSITVAMKFDKPKHRGKVIIDLSNKLINDKAEEVVIESDNDSDVIIQEEEKTEIVLDSDCEEKEKPNTGNEPEKVKEDIGNANKTVANNQKEKAENAEKRESSKFESENEKEIGNEMNKAENLNKMNTEKENKSEIEVQESKSNEENNELSKISSNDKKTDNLPVNVTTKTSDSEKDENNDMEKSQHSEEDVAENSSSGRSRKRSHSVEENSDGEESKKRKTDDEAETQ